MAIRVRLIVGWVAGSFLVSGFVAVPGVEALVLPGWSVSGVVAGDGGLSPLGMDTDRLVSGGVVGVGVVPGVVNRPGFGGRSDSTEGWSYASTKEVSG